MGSVPQVIARCCLTGLSQGVQQLLRAEKRAKDKLEEAKKRKGKRLKQAKEGAVAETGPHRTQRDEGFRPRQSGIMGSQSNVSEDIEEQTLAKMKELKERYSKHGESMVGQLLSIACDVKSEIHMNYQATD